MKPLKTKAGRITRYGFACGYVDDTAHGVRIEKVAYGPGLLVRDRSGHRVLYLGPSLAAARKVARDFAKEVTP